MFRKFVLAIVVVATAFMGYDVDLDARGRSGGSFRSSSPSRSSSKPSGGGWNSSSKARPSSSSKAKPARTQTAKSKADTKAYEKAKSSGKAFPTKKAATSDFKSKAKSDPKTQAALSKQYPTKYDKEPASRPAHVPATYNNQTVIYQNSGYGYMGGGGFSPLMTYMLMDTMSDAMMMNAMSNQGYHIGAAPSPHYTSPTRTGTSPLCVIVSVLLLFGLVIGIIIVVINQ